MCYMECVGIRELRQNLSVYIAKVRAGVSLSVTHRGKPVAVLKPVPAEDDAWQQLIDQGRVLPAKIPFSTFKAPTGRVDPERTVSKYLQEMREDRI